MINAGIVGATGYTGIELVRLLLKHPQVDLQCITSDAVSGGKLSDLFQLFRGQSDLIYQPHDSAHLFDADIVFFATPHAKAMHRVAALLERGIKVIDLSADFRLKDVALWEYWYGEAHAAPELLTQAVYGLPEINRDQIKKAQLIANPGCYPTAISLAILPLLEKEIIDVNGIIADAKSGISGAGRKGTLDQIFCEVSESIKAYAVSGHRHLPEMLQILQPYCNAQLDLTFVPYIVPMLRGIQATLYARLINSGLDVQSVYTERYRDECFIDVMPQGTYPDPRSVRATNLCRIALHTSSTTGRIIVFSVIDNLIKGAAGQAVQNMNLLFGLVETDGLLETAVFP